MRIYRTLLGGAAALALGASAQAATLYTNTFEGMTVDGGATYGAGVTGSFSNLTLTGAATGDWNDDGWVGTFGRNSTTGNPATTSLLSLSGLGSHTQVTATFVLGFLDSWDGNCVGCGNGPDNLEILVGNTVIATMTTNNAGGNEDLNGHPVIAHYQQVDSNQYFSDTLIAYSVTFNHTGGTLDFGIRASGGGWQGGGDESWGIDSASFTYDVSATPPGGGVPEPATWAMMILGFGAAGAMFRRHKALLA
jgi:hypothetical protein